jgi:hypothetical protein
VRWRSFLSWRAPTKARRGSIGGRHWTPCPRWRKLQGLGIEELNTRVGYRPGRGYVHPAEAADEILDEVLQLFLDDLQRRALGRGLETPGSGLLPWHVGARLAGRGVLRLLSAHALGVLR